VRSLVGSSLNLATAKERRMKVRMETEKEVQQGLQLQVIAITLKS